MLQISLAAEKIGSLYGFPISNSLLATWITMAVLFIFTFAATHTVSLVPSGVQLVSEIVIGGLHDFFKGITGDNIDKFFPLCASFFLFILVANWMGLLPGFSTIGFNHTKEAVVAEIPANTEQIQESKAPAETEFIPIFRAATSDLNTTIALALIAVSAVQYFGFSLVGFHYTTKFINFKNPMAFAVGILELISELSRILSFAFRLFGNVFAGEVLLAVMAFLMPFFLPLPFLAMELFVGFIQAFVFSMLVAVFLSIAVTHES
jgi:F-type H+-transporting ATPase subunit a